MAWHQIGLVIIAVLFTVWLVYFVRRNKASFTKENAVKTSGTMGWLTLMIIGVVAFCVIILRQ